MHGPYRTDPYGLQTLIAQPPKLAVVGVVVATVAILPFWLLLLPLAIINRKPVASRCWGCGKRLSRKTHIVGCPNGGHHCTRCGEKGHNRRTCRADPDG